jgi:hypothetical protein
MVHILLYIPPPYKVSGGLGNFKLFFDICKQLRYSIFYCPLIKDIPSIGFYTPFANRTIDSITREELVNYYLFPDRPSEPIYVKNIVTPEILRSRDNVVIYSEDVFGNPAEQKYIVRWLFYFPVPSVLPYYNFESDYICFYSDYIYNFYKYVCISCGCQDFLTKRIQKVNVFRVFKFEPHIYNSMPKRLINQNMKTNEKCFTIRKCFPPVSFSKYNNNINLYYKDIIKNHINSIKKMKKQIRYERLSVYEKKKITQQIIHNTNNIPNLKSFSTMSNYLKDKFLNLNYDIIETRNSSLEYIIYFQRKDFFLSFDPFTFMSIIASLCGCISVIKKIPGLEFNEWVNGDPFNKYGIAYGQEGVQHALNTQHLLLEHITNMYSKNEENVQNLCLNLENKFNIKINKL